MRNTKFRQYRFVLVLALLLPFGYVGHAHAGATQSSSSSYSVSEVQIGGNGSKLNECTGSYCANMSVGDAAVGSASSSGYSAQFGSDTTSIPLLEVLVTGGNQNLGVLQSSTTSTASYGLKVRSYLSAGYSIFITGAAPSQGVHSLKTMSTSCPCTSQPGAEQFGINLAANTTPSVGAAPVQVPDSTFSYGTVTSNYNQPNLFMYTNGDQVASSPSSTGETDYTLSMIFNISNTTPGGQYSGSFSAVVVPTY